jgi:hypothetical protein
MNLIEQINSHNYLFLAEIGEPDENTLRIVIEAGRLGKQITEKDLEKGTNEVEELINSIRSGSFPVIRGENCFVYEILFETYIAYSVRNESFCNWDEYEKFSGSVFRTYSNSRFLDYVKVATFAAQDFTGKFNHYGIIAARQNIDIASEIEPKIKLLRGSEK